MNVKIGPITKLDINNELNEYQKSAVHKKSIAIGIINNTISGFRKLKDYVDNGGEMKIGFLICNPFLFAHTLELIIKGIWELSHSKVFGKEEISKYGHNIHKIYLTLDENAKKFIRRAYNRRVKEHRDMFRESNLSVSVSGNSSRPLSSFPYYSFEECLKNNSKIVIHGKYEFQTERKVNIVTAVTPIPSIEEEGIMFGEVSPFLYDLIEYIEKRT